MSKLTFNLPLNPTSFGQISLCLLRELFEQQEDICLLPISDPQLQHESRNTKFFQWIDNSVANFYPQHNRSSNPTFRLWHINQSLNFLSNNQTLLTFHETDSLTESEINIINNQDRVLVTCQSSLDLFKEETDAIINKIHLPFDKYNFFKRERRQTGDDRIVFTLVGKYEPLRKRHDKVISAWVKEFGDNHKYELRCAISNPFYEEDEFKYCIKQVIKKNYFNVQFLGWAVQNNLYNDLLNQTDIVIGMGNESWGLPEFHAIGLGKHGVILDCLGHQEWATGRNSCLVRPSGMIPADNDKFFQKGHKFNQGNFYDFDETDFIASCYQAIENYNKNPINENGLNIQNEFTTQKFVNNLKEYMS